MTGPRILTIDIETLPAVAYVWRLGEQHVTLDFLQTDWSIMSYAAKWLGEKEIMYADTGGRGKRWVRHDKKLMKPLWDLLDEADLVVGQNAKKFDCRKVNARLVQQGFGPPSPYRVVDTLTASRKYFNFISHKLKHTSSILTDSPKDDHHNYPGIELWKACLADDPKAWKELKKYNCRDVIATEKKYLKIRPWMDNHPNACAYIDSEAPACPKCGSVLLQYRGWEVTQQGRYPRLQCQGCGGWSRGKQTQLPITKRRTMLVPR